MDKIKKVLFIDDSKAINLRNKHLLEDFDLFEEIETYSNADDALASFVSDSNGSNSINLPNLIFLDIEMLEMNAFEFLQKYAKIETVIASGFKPVIIILSDHLLENDNFDTLKRFGSIGVRDQFKKPIDSEDIQVIMEEYLSE